MGLGPWDLYADDQNPAPAYAQAAQSLVGDVRPPEAHYDPSIPQFGEPVDGWPVRAVDRHPDGSLGDWMQRAHLTSPTDAQILDSQYPHATNPGPDENPWQSAGRQDTHFSDSSDSVANGRVLADQMWGMHPHLDTENMQSVGDHFARQAGLPPERFPSVVNTGPLGRLTLSTGSEFNAENRNVLGESNSGQPKYQIGKGDLGDIGRGVPYNGLPLDTKEAYRPNREVDIMDHLGPNVDLANVATLKHEVGHQTFHYHMGQEPYEHARDFDPTHGPQGKEAFYGGHRGDDVHNPYYLDIEKPNR